MQNDEVTWDLLSHYHCSYKAEIETGKFCRNPYNVTGICNRISCPLANSRYATIRDHDDDRESPYAKRLVGEDKVAKKKKLPRNYDKALETIDKHLLYWPKLLQLKIKQRLTKMNQMRIRMRRLALKTREKIMTTPRREIKREARREEKAEKAAELDKVIEKELWDRLWIGIYGKIYDDKVLAEDAEEEEEEKETEIEFVDGYEELEEDDEDMEDFYGFPSNEPGFDNDNEHDSADEEDDSVVIHKKRRGVSRKPDDHGKAKKKARVVVEVEQEDENVRRILKTVS